MKNNYLFFIGLMLIAFSCNQNIKQSKEITTENIYTEIANGNFTNATLLIDKYLVHNKVDDGELYEWNYQKDLMYRIKRDFSQTEEELTGYMKQYYPDLNDVTMRLWEKKKFIEVKIIDGKRMYFKRAGRNFFRINMAQNKVRIAKDGNQSDELDEFRKLNVPEVILEVEKKGTETVQNKSYLMNYKLVVDTNAVPENEIIRCWLPYPRLHEKRQPEVEFISANNENYIIADESQLQRTLYMEKPAEKDKETVFEMSFKIKTAAQWFQINPEKIKPYEKESEFYKLHVAERLPHVVFTEELKNLTDSIVSNEDNPFHIVRKIYTWIDDNIPWASALEYGIMENIPAYVLENKHGDCGMQTLLFMTMAKYKGIPAKWQSGWMLHPGGVNLHDWAEVYFEGIGWVPVDQSFSQIDSEDEDVRYFYANGIDAYRLIVNDDYARDLYPAKIYPRSEPYDFQRGEVEWKGGNLYFDKWDYWMEVEYLDDK